MEDRIQEELLQKLQTLHPDDEVDVIVTLKPDTDLSSIEQLGLKVSRVFESISAVAGTIQVSKVEGLSKLDTIMFIEYDGKVFIQHDS